MENFDAVQARRLVELDRRTELERILVCIKREAGWGRLKYESGKLLSEPTIASLIKKGFEVTK